MCAPAINRVKALTPPDEVKRPVQEFTDAIDSSLADLKDATSAAKSADQARFASDLQRAARDAAKSHAAAREIGVKDCT